MNVIQLGPMLLNFELLILILSAFTGYMTLKYRSSKANVEESISDKFITALILSFFTWKFSLIIFDPVSVIQYPLSLLYYNGGDKGIWLAIAISMIFLWTRLRKEDTTLWINLDVLINGLIAGSSVYHLLLITMDSTKVLFHSLSISLGVGLLIFMYTNKKVVGNPMVMNQVAIWFSLGMIGIFFAEKERIYLLFSFSKEQILLFIIIIIALFVGNALEKKKAEDVI